MKYAICIVAAAPVRKEPSHRVEMTNQLLFGETMEVLEIKEEWLRIRSLYDDYEGWLTQHLIREIDEAEAKYEGSLVATEMVNPVWGDIVVQAPMGSTFSKYTSDTSLVEYEDSLWKEIKRSFDRQKFCDVAFSWVGTPYLWGGKTCMGVDCSGFVQTVFKIWGIKLKRDAWQQAEQGVLIKNIAEALPGDLAFFHNENGKITHVGIVMEDNTIVHASGMGRVRVDKLDEQGISNMETGQRTHQLHSIKRVV